MSSKSIALSMMSSQMMLCTWSTISNATPTYVILVKVDGYIANSISRTWCGYTHMAYDGREMANLALVLIFVCSLS